MAYNTNVSCGEELNWINAHDNAYACIEFGVKLAKVVC